MRESMVPNVRAQWAALLPTVGQMSVDELMALPEHRWRFELIAGQLTPRLPSDLRYDMITRLLSSTFQAFARTANIDVAVVQEVGIAINAAGQPDTMLVPALAMIRSHVVSVSDPAVPLSAIRVVPEFVVEIAATGQERHALGERVRTWLGAGTSIVWVVWPARRQVEVWRSREDAPADADTAEVTIRNVHNLLELEDLLPGFTYPVGHLFS